MTQVILVVFLFCATTSAHAADIYNRLEPLRLEFIAPGSNIFFVEVAVLGKGSLDENKGAHELGYGGNVAFSWVAYAGDVGIRPAIDLSVAYSDEDNRETLSADGLAFVYLDWSLEGFTPFAGLGGGLTYIQDKTKTPAQPSMKAEESSFVLSGDVGVSIAFSQHVAALVGYRYLYGTEKLALSTRRGNAEKIDISSHQARLGLRVRF
jgi:opacity protein-like surface antigen